MKNKKIKTKLAHEIRCHYEIDFITSIKLAKSLMKDNLIFALYKVGFKMQTKQTPICKNECCIDYEDNVLYIENDKGEEIQVREKDLEQLKKKVYEQYGKSEYTFKKKFRFKPSPLFKDKNNLRLDLSYKDLETAKRNKEGEPIWLQKSIGNESYHNPSISLTMKQAEWLANELLNMIKLIND